MHFAQCVSQCDLTESMILACWADWKNGVKWVQGWVVKRGRTNGAEKWSENIDRILIKKNLSNGGNWKNWVQGWLVKTGRRNGVEKTVWKY